MFAVVNIHYSPILHFLALLTAQPSLSVGISILLFLNMCAILPRENGIQVIWHLEILKKKEIHRKVFKRQRLFVKCSGKMEH